MEKSTREYDLTWAGWHKSSYSGGEGGNCLEMAHIQGILIPVIRDSKTPLGPKLTFRTEAWSAFVGGVRRTRLR
ncbi:DUF397 domain-containing protein [Streptomyces naganishii]|uniref:DUF397 domain-containing protein n=1 Tax=Streptomyces naganishii JCM 4654 TaxID=1306179 RepID=A0A919CW46_9ACTN|nr:DUF397 domain-containing protein [Streptomyces naganishii]GHD91354.1 hypothetical protein GCM10010508_39880 [Streptomyces naganishii JCM 4654]